MYHTKRYEYSKYDGRYWFCSVQNRCWSLNRKKNCQNEVLPVEITKLSKLLKRFFGYNTSWIIFDKPNHKGSNINFIL